MPSVVPLMEFHSNGRWHPMQYRSPYTFAIIFDNAGYPRSGCSMPVQFRLKRYQSRWMNHHEWT